MRNFLSSEGFPRKLGGKFRRIMSLGSNVREHVSIGGFIAIFLFSGGLLVASPIIYLNLVNAEARAATCDPNQPIPGKINVKFKSSETVTSRGDAIRAVIKVMDRQTINNVRDLKKVMPESRISRNQTVKRAIGLDRWVEIDIDPQANVWDQIKLWQKAPEVEVAEPIYQSCPALTPNDPQYPSMWHHNNTGQAGGTVGADMDTPAAWDIQTGNRIIVAAIDTEIEWYHPDLVDNIWQNLGEDTDQDGHTLEWSSSLSRYILDPGDINNQDNDGNGYNDDLIGWDFSQMDKDPSVSSGLRHGTYVNGGMAATANTIGVVGPCSNCRMMAIRNSGYVFPLHYAIENGAKVVSFSYKVSDSQALRDEIAYAESQDVLVIIASGNDSNSDPSGICNDDLVLCVGASDNRDYRAYYSNYGGQLDITAPGDAIWTTKENGAYAAFGGTSMAAPVLAGVAGLVRAENPNLSVAEVRSLLQSATNPLVNAQGGFSGTGRLNAYQAVLKAQTTLTTGHYPIANLDPVLTTRIVGGQKLFGTASGTNFGHYEVLAGSGLYPSSMTQIASSSTPVANGLLATLSGLPSGIYQVELRVYDTDGQMAKDDIYPIDWQPTAILDQASSHFDGQYYHIDGSSDSPNFDHYQIQVGLGSNPSTWLIDQTITTPKIKSELYAIDVNAVGYNVVTVKLTTYDSVVGSTSTTWYPLSLEPSQPGWPKSISTGVDYPPLLADIDNDGKPEVIVADSDGIYVFNEDGSVVSGWPQPFSIGSPIAAADVDNDGKLEIILGTPFNSLVALNEDGIDVPNWFVGLAGAAKSISVGDIDNDKQIEVVAVSNNGSITALNRDATVASGWPIQMPTTSVGAAVLANLDGDPQLEIIQAGSDQKIYAYNGDGTTVSGWPVNSPHIKTVAIGHAASGVQIVGAGTNGEVYSFQSNGTATSGWPLQVSNVSSVGDIAVADVDNDGQAEIAIAMENSSTHTGSLYIYNDDGTSVSGWPQSADAGKKMIGNPVMANMDSDTSDIEIAIADVDGKVYMRKSNGSAVSFWHFGSSSVSPAYLAIADVDGNGTGELLEVTESGRLSMWDLLGPSSGNHIWAQFQHDVRRTGWEQSIGCNDVLFTNECKSAKPWYCSTSQTLIKNCGYCGCKSGYSCNSGTGACTENTPPPWPPIQG